MNICTYVSAVSMKPKRYMVAVYHRTKSLENISSSKTAVLQLLGEQHLSLVNTLGKKSGLNYHKENYLTKKKLITLWHNKKVLINCAGQMELKKLWANDTGDHTMFLFDVKRFQSNHESVLTLDDLRAKGLIRI